MIVLKIVAVIIVSSIVSLFAWFILRYVCNKRVKPILDFVDWYDENEEELMIKFAETGEDRELDFDLETACDREYELYLNQSH